MGMPTQEMAESHGLLAKISADCVVAARGFVPFVEYEIEALVHRIEALGQLLGPRHFEIDSLVA